MSRSGYHDYECDRDEGMLNLYRGAVESAIRGKRGQRLLRDLRDALLAMPERRLIAHEFVDNGQYCALGVLGAQRGLPVETMDFDAPAFVGQKFDIAESMAREIAWANDEGPSWGCTPEQRWRSVMAWVLENLNEGDTSEPTA